MTRRSYMAALERKLEALDSGTRSEVILEIESHVDDLVRKYPDESEEVAIARLDPPEVVAAAILGEVGAEKAAESGEKNESAGRNGRHRMRWTFDLKDFLEAGMRMKNSRPDSADAMFHQEIQADTISRILVKVQSADVVVRVSHGPVVIDAEGLTDEGQLLVTKAGADLLLEEQRRPRGIESLRLRIPARILSVSVATASGDIATRGIDAGLALTTASGDIRIEDGTDATVKTSSGDVVVAAMLGNVAVSTLSGDVRIDDAGGDLEIRTASGKVEATGCGGEISCTSASGDIGIDAAASFSGAVISTASGNVECALESGADVTVRAVSISGNIDIGGRSGGDSPLRFGRGTYPLTIRSASGDITVKLG